MVAGIHHITLITRKVQANVDFYVGFLGLRLVKRTGGFEDATQLHLFYGDATGTPGSLITFLVWEDGSPGRAGYGQTGEIALAIAPLSIGFWLTRALTFGLKVEGPMDEFGEPALRLKDPDGMIVKLVGNTHLQTDAPWQSDDIPAEHAISRIRGATLFTEKPAESRAFLERHFDYRLQSTAGTIQRMVSASGDIIDVRDAQGFWSSAPGTGTVDHIAFRAADDGELQGVTKQLQAADAGEINVHDRKYFRSLYVREPGGILFELATDAPGMLVDETGAALGTRLFLPAGNAERERELTLLMPQFAMPGEPRVIYRDLPFVHRFYTPEDADGSVIVLLHGSGANETSLLPFANRNAPRATLLAVRGRAVEDDLPRWFLRLDANTFDQADIAQEAEAFAAFIEGAVAAYGLDTSRLTYLGYSNGANLINAMLWLQPHLIRRAVLLRSMLALETLPAVNMAEPDVLMISGEFDSYGRYSEELQAKLETAGAKVTARTVPRGHEIAEDDISFIQAWMAQA